MSNGTYHRVRNEESAIGFSRGEENAFSFFYHEFYAALVHYSFQMIQSRAVAEDIVTDAFVKTWRMHYKLNTYGGIKAYLYTVVHRDSIAAVLKERKNKSEQEALPERQHSDNPFELLVRSEACRLIHAALNDLTPASKRVVVLHYLEGKSTGEIARELKLHPSTIKTQKQHALKALKKIFVRPMLWPFYFFLKSFLLFS